MGLLDGDNHGHGVVREPAGNEQVMTRSVSADRWIALERTAIYSSWSAALKRAGVGHNDIASSLIAPLRGLLDRFMRSAA